EIQSRSMIQPPSARSKKPFTVMIVDDSVSVRRVVSNLIKNAGWHSITAKDGLEALEMIYSATQYPDLILLDIEMPRMDGYEFLSAIRAQDDYQHIPVVILTSRSSEKHRGRALELGASAYVIKPYQDETLLDIIRQQGQDPQEAASA
ncbi:MAG: response regulator, partial [Chloroflexota bacterium]